MGRVWSLFQKHQKSAILVLLVALAVLSAGHASAQQPCDKEVDPDMPDVQCPPGIPLDPNDPVMSQAVPLMDGNTSLRWPPVISAIGHRETVTLYGSYGNDERTPASGPAYAHYQRGLTEASQIHPIDGAIVFLFIGFSNCTIEICGGDMDIWQQPGGDLNPLPGQPCATDCPNPKVSPPVGYKPWNQTNPFDGVTQQSFLYRVYSPTAPLVGPHVYVFDGARGHETLAKWDPNAFYADHTCGFPEPGTHDPECNYTRVIAALEANGLHANQVQAIFVKMSTGGPQCDLSGFHCAPGVTEADAYTSERYLGNIMRYLKLGYNGNPVRFPNLHQVFITSRIYGLYAQVPAHNACNLNPEPYAYEESFAMQRLIVAQIRQAYGLSAGGDIYSGQVDYSNAPWFDWGPYLWANGARPRNDGLFWCDTTSTESQCLGHFDFRYGDLNLPQYWGDHTHPTAEGAQKVANKLVEFISNSYSGPHFVQSWIHQ
jgi:hypothetical protein